MKHFYDSGVLMKSKKTVLNNVKVVDLFAGIGGFHLAFRSFGAKIVYASEWDINASKIYEKNFNIKPSGDITKIEAKDIPDHDILCAGFPCQAFSISGKRLGFDDSRGTLFFEVARIVKEKLPKIVFMENVKNFATHDNGRTLEVVKNTMTDLGYTFFSKVLNASEYGIPQSRQRIYMIAFREDMKIVDFDFPKPIELKMRVKDILLSEEATQKYVVDRNDVFFNGVEEKISNKPIRLGIVNKGGQGERIYSTLGTAITLSAYGGGVGAKTGLYFVNGNVRRLAPRECARLMGFPDDFVISENDNVCYQQFGNSVVIDVLQSIIEQMINYEGILKCLE